MTTADTLDTIAIPVAEYEALREIAAVVSQLQRDNKRLSDQLAVLIKRVFGRSTERLDPNQLAFFATELANIAPEAAPAMALTQFSIRSPSRSRAEGSSREGTPRSLGDSGAADSVE